MLVLRLPPTARQVTSLPVLNIPWAARRQMWVKIRRFPIFGLGFRLGGCEPPWLIHPDPIPPISLPPIARFGLFFDINSVTHS